MSKSLNCLRIFCSSQNKHVEHFFPATLSASVWNVEKDPRERLHFLRICLRKYTDKNEKIMTHLYISGDWLKFCESNDTLSPSTSTTSACVMTWACNVCDKRPCWTTKTTAPGKSCIESNGCSGSPGIASTPKGNAKVWNKHDFELNQFVLIALQRLCSVSHPFAKAKASWSISSTWQNWWRRKCTSPS